MPSSPVSTLGRWFRNFWSVVDSARRHVVNILFLAVVLVLLVAVVRGGRPALDEHTALVLNLNGPLVEQRAGGARSLFALSLRAGETKDTRLRDVLAVLDAAAKDPKIDRVLLSLDDLSSAGLPVLREVAAALERFKASGKAVVAWGTNYDQAQYYLAAHATEVYLHPMGVVLLEGFGGYRNYYKDALDRIGVSANVIRVGSYKNFGEPYSANAPSKETLESETYLYNGLWATYTDGVEKARKLPHGSIAKLIEDLPQQFADAGNDMAKLALKNRLVDGLKTRDELRQLLIERGAMDRDSKSFRQVDYDAYLAGVKPQLFGDAIGVVVAEGSISNGIEPAGSIGGRSTAELIRKAREDTRIKAIVLRVNSPGGSAVGSELIRRELEVTRAAGKPVVVSMGNVAASGGYWISMAADEVIADPATITGSIGVIALLPTADKAMQKLSINTGGYTTTWLAGSYDPRRPLDPRLAQLVQGMIKNVYSEFTTKAAAARKTTPEKIDAIAQGRVWTGAQALERNLIDRTGNFEDAIKAAAARAKIPETTRVAYIEPELTLVERIAQNFGNEASSLLAKVGLRVVPAGLPAGIASDVQQDLEWLAGIADSSRTGIPFVALAHCLCGR
jgi:protease IV